MKGIVVGGGNRSELPYGWTVPLKSKLQLNVTSQQVSSKQMFWFIDANTFNSFKDDIKVKLQHAFKEG